MKVTDFHRENVLKVFIEAVKNIEQKQILNVKVRFVVPFIGFNVYTINRFVWCYDVLQVRAVDCFFETLIYVKHVFVFTVDLDIFSRLYDILRN